MKFASVGGVDLILRPITLALFLYASWIGTLREMCLMFAALILHETAHVLAARAAGIRVEAIELSPFGGLARMDEAFELQPTKEILIALAGPTAGVLAALLTSGLVRAFQTEIAGADRFVRMNFSIAAVNLFPAFPLDGARAARALLGMLFNDKTSRKIVCGIGLCGGAACMILFVLSAVYGVSNPTLPVMGAVVFFFSLIERKKTSLSVRRLAKGSPKPEHGVIQVRTLAVSADQPIHSLLGSLDYSKYHEFLVFKQDGSMLGKTDQDAAYACLLKKSAARFGELV